VRLEQSYVALLHRALASVDNAIGSLGTVISTLDDGGEASTCQQPSVHCLYSSITRDLCQSTMRCAGLCRTASANAALPRLRSAEAAKVCSSLSPLASHCSTLKGKSSSKCPIRV